MFHIPAVKIEITRAEGPHEEVGKPEVCTREAYFGIWDCADRILIRWSHTAPKAGGYDKCDFTVTWEDGETYNGRYDLKHHAVEFPNLAKHVYDFAMFHAGLWSSWMTEEQYRDFLNRPDLMEAIPKFQHFLQTYELGNYNTGPAEYSKLSESHLYAKRLPKQVLVFATTIEKHYVASKDCHSGSVRVVKPKRDILVYLGCLKSHTWRGNVCSPKPTVLMTIVPRNKHYEEELRQLKVDHPGLRITDKSSREGVEASEPDPEVALVEKALQTAEVVA